MLLLQAKHHITQKIQAIPENKPSKWKIIARQLAELEKCVLTCEQ